MILGVSKDSTVKNTWWLNYIAWVLSGSTVFLAVVVWGQNLNAPLAHLSIYDIFPLLGLIAFSLMWAHYIMSGIKQRLELDKKVLSLYFEATSLVVLAAILLHPGLLIYQLYRDGFGFYPHSVLVNYVAPNLRWAALLGSISLPVFLAYELRRKYQARHWWKWVAYASDAAMVTVFVHALKLGRHTQTGWYHYVWITYGMAYLLTLTYIYHKRFRLARNAQAGDNKINISGG
jgi:hypothetical protein